MARLPKFPVSGLGIMIFLMVGFAVAGTLLIGFDYAVSVLGYFLAGAAATFAIRFFITIFLGKTKIGKSRLAKKIFSR